MKRERKSMISILPDYHIHTRLCNHASGEMEEYVDHALEIGLAEIGFSDHMPVMPEPHLCMSYDDLPTYVTRIRELQKKYEGMIAIRCGCEMDIVTNRVDEIKDIIQTYQFDYIIGSIHYLDTWPFDQVQYKDKFEMNNIEAIYKRFFSAFTKAATLGLYDIAGHIDNIKCMGYRPQGDLSTYYERVASVMKSLDLTVELNTSGIDKPCGEPYPSMEFLRILCQHEIPVTVGSDSHNPKEVGRHYDRACAMLKDAGYDHVVYYKNRKRFFKPLGFSENCQELKQSSHSQRMG